jgi:hypothetical protein
VNNPSSTSSDCRVGLLPRHTVTTDDAAAAANDDQGSRSKTEQDAAADSSTDVESRSTTRGTRSRAVATTTRATTTRATSTTSTSWMRAPGSRSTLGCCRRAAVLLRASSRTNQQSNDRTSAASRSADRSLVFVAGLRRRLRRAAVLSRSSRRFLLARVDGEIKARRSQRRRGSHAWVVYTGATTAQHRSRQGRS